jgi:antitoxin component of RelBE/YafQ-DinJ toxin-antitoxin module
MTLARQRRAARPKSEVVQIRLSAADKADLLRAAEALGLSLSAWIRMVLLTEARRGRRRENE